MSEQEKKDTKDTMEKKDIKIDITVDLEDVAPIVDGIRSTVQSIVDHVTSDDRTRRAAEAARDDFWDLDKMLPKRQPVSTGEVYGGHRDTDAVEVTFGEDAVYAGGVGKLPPIPNITSRGERRRSGGEGLSARAHTPGDVRPQMSVPVLSYEPKGSFIRSVGVFRWPSRYNYYERFTADAERYYNRAAPECPFVPFFAYMPQHSQMSAEQLRWYLYWRDNVRHGVYLTTDYSYLFLYVFEIINLPEKIKPEAGLTMLTDLWLAYREAFPRLDRYMGEWICDYCLIYALDPPLDALRDILPKLIDKLSFKEFFVRVEEGGTCPFTPSLCDLLSNYNWRQSKYATSETRPVFEHHLYAAVMGALTTAWQTGEDIATLFGLSEVQQTRNAFSGALCSYNCKRRIDVRYVSLSRSYQLRYILTDLYKLAENCIRAHLGIKSRLSAAGIPDGMKQAVKAYFNAYLPPMRTTKTPEEKEAARAAAKAAREAAERAEEAKYASLYEPLSTTLSTDAAIALEAASWSNTELLVTEEGPQSTEERESSPSPKAPPLSEPAEAVADAIRATEEAPDDMDELPDSDDPYVNFIRHLNPTYYQALKHIIAGEIGEYKALCASVMLLPEAMADAINEIAVTYTDDTALDADGEGFWHLSDYYANEIMEAVIEREDV